ncbi:MAG: hypothetical protein V1714_04170 [Pseudomonadota bacterium]
MRRNIPFTYAVLFLMSAPLFCLIGGCGKKGPPVAPGAKPLPALSDLRLTMGIERIWLTWSIPDEMKKISAGIKGFAVYRYKISTAEPECKDCPILFRRMAQVPLEIRLKDEVVGRPFSYEDRVESGNRYIYKVTVLMEDGRESPDSNFVPFSN